MGKRKKLLGLVLVVCMLFTLTPITSRADVTTEKWTDFTAADFAGGSGTKVIHIRLLRQDSLQSWHQK